MSETSHPNDNRNHIQSGLMRESLVSSQRIESTKSHTIRTMVPGLNMLAIGGQSIMDRGKEAILPVVEAIVEARKDHKLIVGVGGGARHKRSRSRATRGRRFVLHART